LEAVLEKVKWEASKVKEAIEKKEPPELAMSRPSLTLPGVVLSSSPQENNPLDQARVWLSALQVVRPEPKSWEEEL
jgi:hypothetical protein